MSAAGSGRASTGARTEGRVGRARCTARMISGVPIAVGSTQASGLAQFTTSAAVTK